MSILLFGAALLVGLSALLKIRATHRLGMGVSPFAVMEGLAAVALSMLGLVGMSNGSAPAPWIIPGALVLLVVSSIDHARRLRFVRERREATEAGRLATFLGRPGGEPGPPGDL